MAETVIRQRVTLEARDGPRITPCVMCVGKSDSWIDFTLSVLFR